MSLKQRLDWKPGDITAKSPATPLEALRTRLIKMLPPARPR